MSHLSAERIAALVEERPTAAELAHLSTCVPCARERAGYEALAVASRSIPQIGPPLTSWESLAPALVERGLLTPKVAPRVAPGSKWAGPSRYLSRAAGIVLLVATGALLGRATAPAGSGDTLADLAARVISSADLPFDNLEEAEAARDRAERVFHAATAYLAVHDTSYFDASPEALRSRLVALDAIRGARFAAPNDPVINGYLHTAAVQSEATLRQLNATLPASLGMTVY